VGNRPVNVVFTAALFAGTAAVSGWLAVRVPRLASAPILAALVAAAVAVEILTFAPIWSGSYVALYASVFGVVFPLLVVVWLSVITLLGAMRGSAFSR
jgi:hypothetical protein